MQDNERGAVMGALKAKGKPKSHVHSIHVKRADSGGFIAHHEASGKDGEAQHSEHIVPDIAALQDHLQQNMGDQPAMASAAPPPDPAAAAPGAGAPPPEAMG